jgi:hypothetical protein
MNGSTGTGRGGRPPVIAVLLPMVWSVRNVVHAGVLARLADAGASVHLLFLHPPTEAGPELRRALARAAACHGMLAAEGVSGRGKALADGIIRSAFSRRNRIASYALYQRWFSRDSRVAERLRTGAVDALGVVARAGPVFRRLESAREGMYRSGHDLTAIRAQLAAIGPDLVWSTVCVAGSEYPYALAARDLRIPLLTSILSFDNLTSRGALPRYDHYHVWCDAMRDELLRLYPGIAANCVEVTGTPQFDFHRRAERWPRDRTLAALGLPPGSRYLAYAASHRSLTPEEPALVAQMAERIGGSPVLGAHRLVVRMHPLDDWSRWHAAASSARVTLSPAWDQAPGPDGWALGSVADQQRLVATFAHADACLNVASTATLDAAVLDRPVVGIDFRDEAACPRGILYEEYDADHYRPLVASGGLRVARSWTELTALLERAVGDPSLDRAARAAMVARECGTVDGMAADRVAAAVLRRARAHPAEVVA